MSNPNTPGDSGGLRIHRWRAQRLSEAGRIGRVMDGLLHRAGITDFDLDRLLERVTDAERAELQAAHGRIEPRRRFHGGIAQPLLGRRARNLLFIDECGQSFPRPDLATDHFALAGVAISPEDAARWAEGASRVKRDFGIVETDAFHEPDMRHRTGKWGFGGNIDKQRAFDDAVMRLLQATPFVAFGAGVRKRAFAAFMEVGSDPYLPTDVYAIAIQLMLERYVDYLAMSAAGRPMGRVRFESQGAVEDAHHARDYISVLIDGTQWIAGAGFRQWLETGPRFVPKEPGGVEIADMLARDILEWIRDDCMGMPGRWSFFSERIYCRGDRRMGLFGVKVFPDSDIREQIESHRDSAGASPR